MADQTYRVLTVYDTQDKSSRAMTDIARSADMAARSSRDLKNTLQSVGGLFLGGKLFGAAKASIIDYNRGIEDSKVVIGGMLSMFSGAPMEKSFDRAAISVARFEQMAKKSSLTTKDLVATAAGLVRPLLQAGISVTDIEEMTFGVANAAKAMGMSGEVVAMDIEQALTSNVGQRDRFARNILAQKSIGLNADQFNALGIEKRVEVLKKALTSDAIKAMAAKQGEDTFSGVLSTLQDNLEILAGRIGLPLFKAITAEVKEWNGWLDKNQKKLNEFGKDVGGALVSGFKFVKDVFSFLYHHADTLIAVAKAYAAIKIGQMIGGGLSGGMAGGGNFLGSIAAWMKKGTAGSDSIDPMTGEYKYTPGTAGGRGRQAVGGFKGVAENAGMIGASFGTGYAVGTMINDMTGLSDSIAGVTKLNGQVLDVTDRTTREYVSLIRSMQEFDKTLDKTAQSLAKTEGAGGSDEAVRIAALSTHYKNQLNEIRDLAAMQTPGFMWDSAMGASGLFDDREKEKFAADPEKFIHHLEMLTRKLDEDLRLTTDMANDAWKSLPEEVRKGVDEKAAINALMSHAKAMLPDDASQFNVQVIMTPEDIKAAFAKIGVDDVDKGFQAKPPQQNVTINIQQVMAKDPNRWLADMDDMVARRTRARTRAKGAWKSSPH